MTVYTVRSIDFGYRVIKLSDDGDVEAVYKTARDRLRWICDCPARTACKHPKIIASFEREKKVNTGWLLDWERQEWERPFNDAVRLLKRKMEQARAQRKTP